MKVLHLIDSGGLYGAEKMLLALVTAQLQQGLEPMILSAGDPAIEEKPLEAEAKRLELPLISWRMKPGLNVRESRKILKWASSNGYHILHSHGFKFNVLLGSYPKMLRRIPMVATLHGYVHARRFSKMWFYELLDRFAITFLQGVVLVGEAMKKELPDHIVTSEKVRVIPNGLDIDAILLQAEQPIERLAEEFVGSHSPIVLGVGRLSQEKGFDRLIDSFQIVCEKFDNPGLIIVGEGKQRINLETRVAELELRDKVLMPGYSSNVPGLLRTANLFVIPSLTEGLPITLLEAMAVGVPILASPVGEIPAVLGFGDGGYVLPESSDINDLGDLMVDVLERFQDRSKVDWSLKEVASSYSIEWMERRYREFYRRATAS